MHCAKWSGVWGWISVHLITDSGNISQLLHWPESFLGGVAEELSLKEAFGEKELQAVLSEGMKHDCFYRTGKGKGMAHHP